MTSPIHRYSIFNDRFDHPPTLQDLRMTIGLEKCPAVDSAENIVVAFAAMGQLKREVLVACAVDRRSRLIAWNLVACSSHDHGLRNVGGVFASAVCGSGAGIVLLRNSRKPELRTSTEEFAFIRRTSEAAQVLGFALLDYIVLSSSSWCSLFERPLVEAYAGTLNLSHTQATPRREGVSQWQCRSCKKTNRTQMPVYPPIYGTYTPAHCEYCRQFAWLFATVRK